MATMNDREPTPVRIVDDNIHQSWALVFWFVVIAVFALIVPLIEWAF
jgi:hypothetical protein